MSFLKDLNDVQVKAVKAVKGPVLVIAGAGSGKTRMLTYRIAHLLQLGVPAYQILALTFTNKAANEMKQRAIRLIGEKVENLWIGTFHSIFARILRREAEYLDFSSSFTIYDADDTLKAVRRCYSKIGGQSGVLEPKAIQSAISRAKNDMIDPNGMMTKAKFQGEKEIAAVYKEYEKLLKKSNALDFDDLLIKPIKLFREQPQVLTKYQDRFKFILIDEFQDTNKAQYYVIKQLAGKLQNICVVGDDAQSIYSFRGAQIENILSFENDFGNVQVFRMEQNYRSTKKILDVANSLIKFNNKQYHKEIWTENSDGEAVRIIECLDEKDEASKVVSLICEQMRKSRLDSKNFAVLYRTNAQSRVLEDSMRKNGMAYVMIGTIRFYERKEVKDVIAYLRLLCNSRDETSLLRIINYPVRGIGDTTIEKVQKYAIAKKLDLFSALEKAESIPDIYERGKQGIKQFLNIIKKCSFLKKEVTLTELVRTVVAEIGLIELFKAEGTDESLNRLENVQELFSAVNDYVNEHPEAALENFLEEVALVSDIDEWDETRNAVTLMTLHSSKGLEFPVVIITGLEDGLLPHSASEEEEERRLFYVGITRAQRNLFVLFAKQRNRFGELTYQTKSKFLSQLGEKSVIQEHIQKEQPEFRATDFIFGASSKRISKPRIRSSDEHLYKQHSPNYEDESQEEQEIAVGAFVNHETFGKGKVIEINGRGENRRATVFFEGVGKKVVILKYLRLP